MRKADGMMEDEPLPGWIKQLPQGSYGDLRIHENEWHFKLRQPVQIDSIPCASGTEVSGDATGLLSGTLAAYWQYKGVQLPPDTEFEFSGPYGELECRIDGPLTVYGRMFPGVRKIRFPYLEPERRTPGLTWLAKYTNEDIARRWGYLRDKLSVFFQRQFVPIPFDCQLTLTEPTEGPGFELRYGDRVWLDRSGRLSRLYISRFREIQDMLLFSGTVWFDKAQNVRRFQPYFAQGVRGLPVESDSEPVEFHRNGVIHKLVLGNHHTVDDQSFRKGTKLEFNPRGEIQRVVEPDERKAQTKLPEESQTRSST